MFNLITRYLAKFDFLFSFKKYIIVNTLPRTAWLELIS